MRSIQTSVTFPLSSVKPLERLQQYRAACLAATRRALAAGPRRRRTTCPVDGRGLEPYGAVEGLAYVRCPACRSVLLEEVAAPAAWAAALEETARARSAPNGFHATVAQSRTDHVYAPKLEWIRDTLQLQQVERPRILEVTGGGRAFTSLVRESGIGRTVVTSEAMALLAASDADDRASVEAAILLESLDYVEDPLGLLRAVLHRVAPGGLVFVTALVCSGFDVATLGVRNLYLCPPDRTNAFSLQGLSSLLAQAGCQLLEVSTPGVLDVEIVRAHLRQDRAVALSAFERQVVDAGEEARQAFQAFLQAQGLSSFARVVGRKG